MKQKSNKNLQLCSYSKDFRSISKTCNSLKRAYLGMCQEDHNK